MAPLASSYAVQPISTRPIDLFYRTVFSFIFMISVVADCSPLYPEWLQPPFVHKMHAFQYSTFKDPFFDPSITRPWFDALLVLELLVLVPLNAWLLYGWTVDHRLVPINMLIYAYHMAVTTVPCLVEIYKDETLTSSQINWLFAMYGPFVLLPVFMVFDAYTRITNGSSPFKSANVENINGKPHTD